MELEELEPSKLIAPQQDVETVEACLLVQDGGLRGFDGRKSQFSPG